MCGIAGMVGCADPEIMQAMTRILAHRGPDDEGIHCIPEDDVAFGHRRLSIIDLSAAGHQPMCDAREELWITYNGEIYNFQEIREELQARGHRFQSQTDTETVLYAYREWGVACLQKFNGMFAFGIWDRRDRSLFLARDRLGIKPLFYTQCGNTFLFASEIKALLQFPGFARRINWTSLASTVMFGWSPAPLSPFSDIHLLEPGHLLTIENGVSRKQTYWQLRIENSKERARTTSIHEFDSILTKSIRRQMMSDVPIGALLSGGVDSATVVAKMAQESPSKIKTYTAVVPQKHLRHEAMPDDAHFARLVAKLLRTDHHEITIDPKDVENLPKTIWHHEDFTTDSAAIITRILCQKARDQGALVLLTGTGGDEIFGGYRKHLSVKIARAYSRLVPSFVHRLIACKTIDAMHVSGATKGHRYRRWLKRFIEGASPEPLSSFLSFSSQNAEDSMERLCPEIIRKIDLTHLPAVAHAREIFAIPDVDITTKMCAWDTKYYLSDWNLAYNDRASMASSVELRPPLCDEAIVEFMSSAPPKARISFLRQKALFKRASEAYLPKRVVHRPKANFGAPLRAWMKGPLKPMLDDTLSETAVRNRGFFNAKAVETLIRDNNEGREDNALRLWNLMCMELWARQFLDPTPGI